MTTKTCFKCEEVKSLDAFYAHPTMKDGYLNKCKECTKKDATNHRNANIERIREYDRKRAKRPENVRARTLSTKAWRQAHPEGWKAHIKVNNAVQQGKISKPDSCELCDTEPSIVHGHHPDYSRPLQVVWVCPACHASIHRKRGNQ